MARLSLGEKILVNQEVRDSVRKERDRKGKTSPFYTFYYHEYFSHNQVLFNNRKLEYTLLPFVFIHSLFSVGWI